MRGLTAQVGAQANAPDLGQIRGLACPFVRNVEAR